MKEFNYKFDYKNTMFMPNDKRYRIGRGEQGVLLVRPYTNDICKYWRFKTPTDAAMSSMRILFLYHQYKDQEDMQIIKMVISMTTLVILNPSQKIF